MEQVIQKYLQTVILGYRWVTLEKIDEDIQYDEELKGTTLTEVVRVALNNGWKLYEVPEEGWSIGGLD